MSQKLGSGSMWLSLAMILVGVIGLYHNIDVGLTEVAATTIIACGSYIFGYGVGEHNNRGDN